MRVVSVRFFDVLILYWSVVDLECCVSVPQNDSVPFTRTPVLFTFFSHWVVPERRVAPRGAQQALVDCFTRSGVSSCQSQTPNPSMRLFADTSQHRLCLHSLGLPRRQGLWPSPLLRSFCFSAGGGALTRLLSASADPPLPPDDHPCAKVAFPGAGRLLSPSNVS